MAEDEVGARLSLKGRREFSQDAERASKDIRGIGDSADRADTSGRRMAGGMGLAQKGIGGLATVAKVGVAALAATAAGLGAVAVKTIGLAMDAGETESKFNTVFAGMEEQVGSFVKATNQEFGIPTKDLQDAAATFGVFAKAAGVPQENLAEFSTSLTQAGLDLGSFYNQDPTEVFASLQSGLAGQAEPLTKFGIFMSAAALDAFALEQGLGKTTKQMTEQEKVALRQAFILANLGDANGDLGKTQDSLANKTKALRGRLTEAGTAIGTSMLPYATWLAEVLDERLAPAVTWLQNELPGMVNATASSIGDAFTRMKDVWDMGGSYGETAAALTGFSAVEEPVNRVADALGDVWVILQDGLFPAIQTVSDALPSFMQPLDIADGLLDTLADNAETLHPLIVGLVGAWVLWNAAVLAHNIVMGVSGFLMAARVGVTMLLTGATGLNTAAELTRNQALVASVALHARMAGALALSLARTLATTAATVAMSVVMGTVRAATMAWTAAQWLLNVAMSANPLGLVVIGIALLVGALVIAWKKSETFRAVVTGAFDAVKRAGTAVKNEIVTSFNNMVSFFSSMPSRITSATRGLFNGIKAAFKSAVNWIIDKWNNLSFGIPAVSVAGKEVFGGTTLSTPNIPRLHSGGTTVTGGSAIIQPDEEIVVLPPAATVVPLDNRPAIAAATGGAQQGPITLQVVLDRRVVAEAVYEYTGDRVARR